MERRSERQILVMAALTLGMAGAAVRGIEPPATVGRASQRILAPVQERLTAVAVETDGFIAGLREMRALRQHNAELEEQLNALSVEVSKLEDLKRENGVLREELAFRQKRLDLDLTGAGVTAHRVAGEPGSLLHTVRVDVGEAEDVAVGQSVVSSRGLVGQITNAAGHSSDVRLITDPGSAVWARVQRSRATGVVFGSTTGDLRMRFLPQNAPGEQPHIAEGDLIYTSGLSEQFPPLILIGQVVDVLQSNERTHQEAVIRPSVDFNALEVVLVVTKWRADGTADEQAARD